VSNLGTIIIPSNDGRFESTDANIEYTGGGEGVTGNPRDHLDVIFPGWNFSIDSVSVIEEMADLWL